MCKKYLSLVLLLFPLLVFSQKAFVKGTVNDKDENPAIATIEIKGPNVKNGIAGANTDEQGSFGVELPAGTYTIRIFQQGHKDFVDTIVMEPGKNINLGTIRLKEAPVTLGEYTLTDNTHKVNTNVSIITITKEDIQRIPATMGESDIVGALLVTPGV